MAVIQALLIEFDLELCGSLIDLRSIILQFFYLSFLSAGIISVCHHT
jgi:hypothetical protein